MHNSLISTKTRVTVGNMVFEIPSEKVSEIVSLLSRLQAIKETSNYNNGQNCNWNGQSLICG